MFLLVVANECLMAQAPKGPISGESGPIELLGIQDSSDDQNQTEDQTLEGADSAPTLDYSPVESADPPQPQTDDGPEEDKWALTDEDRMSDEEMDEELFGKSKESPEELDVDGEEKSDTPLDQDENSSSESDDSPEARKKQARLAPRQTIETYLRGINTLTVDTVTSPGTSLDGVDVPMRLTPPQTISVNRFPSAATVRFQTPDIHHQPLYFEDQNLERYGVHRYRLQPFESARQFTSDSISLPREIRAVPPRSCIYRANRRYNQPSLIPANR